MKAHRLYDVGTWREAAVGLRARLYADYRNHAMLYDPWARAAHSMVQGWRIIASQGRLDYVPQPRRRTNTWKEAAHTMKHLLNTRRRQRLLDSTTWRFWANHLPQVHLRYVRKAFREGLPP